MTDLPPDPGILVIELEVNNPRYNFALIASAHKKFPDAPITLLFGEYDDDPRELWEIEEVRKHVAKLIEFGLNSGLKHWQQDHFKSVFCRQTLAFFCFCMNPELVRRGETGNYYIFGEGA